jgi:hypothetical protein
MAGAAPQVKASAPVAAQPALQVSRPEDASEREAEQIARTVMHTPASAFPAARVPLMAARAVDRHGASPPPGAPGLPAGGQPLPAGTRRFMEGRLGADLSRVRVHTGSAAAGAAAGMGARAFTYGRDIYFGGGEYQPESASGRELIAHELVHTIQQRAAVQRAVLPGTQVQAHSPPMAQRGIGSRLLGAATAVYDTGASVVNAVGDAIGVVIQKVKDYFAEKAAILPGFTLFTMVIGKNPINDAPVNASGADMLRQIVGSVPFGDKVVEALDNHGIFDKGAAFIAAQFKALKRLGANVVASLKTFFSSLGPGAALDLSGTWNAGKALVTSVIDEVISFAKGLVKDFAKLVQDAIIKPLGRWAASKIHKFDLLAAVLGKNPISDEGESPAATIIGAFMKLIGQEEIWNNIRKGNAVGRAWTWFQGAMRGARSLVTSIPGRVMTTIKSLTIVDLVTIAGAFKKIMGAFASFVGDFASWAGGTVLELLEIILLVVAPNAVPYLKKAGGAFKTIIRNPIGFVRTLVAAGKQGFTQFAGNFLTHLKAALIGWLTGALAGAGVYIPQGFNLREILKFVLSVMGLTWANIRAKLVRAVGETAVKALETGFDIVKTLVTEGPAAAWQKIVETINNLKEMAIDAVMSFVKSKIVEIAVTKLLSMLSPAGAFIQALIAIYNTIMFFVERLRQIAAVAASFIDSIAAIARGTIAPAAARVERTLAGMLVLAISFLARLASLGRVSDAITGLIQKIRAPIDRALDRVVEWIVSMARRLGRFVAQAGVPNDPAKRLELAGNHAVTLARPLAGKATRPLLQGALGMLKTRYALSTLVPYESGGEWWVSISINPGTKKKLGVKGAAKAATTAAATSTDPKIASYEKILNGLSLPLIQNETNPDKYREKMRNSIVTHYQSKTVSELNSAVFQSGVIPRALNRIRGDIFELWLDKNGVMNRQSPVFVDNRLKRKRVADGVIGTATLVDAKVRRPNTKPSPSDKAQMTDYGIIIKEAIKAVNVTSIVELGPFKSVKYIFNDSSLITLWTPDLVANVGAGKYSTG